MRCQPPRVYFVIFIELLVGVACGANRPDTRSGFTTTLYLGVDPEVIALSVGLACGANRLQCCGEFFDILLEVLADFVV